MPTFRQALGFIISFATFIYLVLYLRNDPPRSLLGNVPGPRIQHSTRIVAVGDLHGDTGNAQKVLEMARVIDSYGMWSGEIDVFVQTGDIIDRWVPCTVNTWIADFESLGVTTRSNCLTGWKTSDRRPRVLVGKCYPIWETMNG
jgi:hypothetical protein